MAAVRKGKRGAGGARKGRLERKTTEIVFDRSEVGWVLGKLKASGYLIKSSRLVGRRKAGSGETSSGQLPILLQGLLLTLTLKVSPP